MPQPWRLPCWRGMQHALFYFYLIIIIVVLWFSEKHHFLIPDFKIQKNQNDVFFRIIEGEQ